MHQPISTVFNEKNAELHILIRTHTHTHMSYQSHFWILHNIFSAYGPLRHMSERNEWIEKNKKKKTELKDSSGIYCQRVEFFPKIFTVWQKEGNELSSLGIKIRDVTFFSRLLVIALMEKHFMYSNQHRQWREKINVTHIQCEHTFMFMIYCIF